jgi:hypothetical protein
MQARLGQDCVYGKNECAILNRRLERSGVQSGLGQDALDRSRISSLGGEQHASRTIDDDSNHELPLKLSVS